MPKPPPIDHLPNDDEPTEVEPRPRGAEPDEIELVEAEPVALEVGVVTDKNFEKGPKNEDAVLVDERSDTYGVLDGMGGAAAGEVASSRASEFIREELVKMPDGIKHDGAQVADYLKSAIVQAGGKLQIMAEADPKLKGMGTTCSIMHVLKGPDGKPRELITAQVGDSRVHRLRRGKLERITKDQSLVQTLVDVGLLPGDADQRIETAIDVEQLRGLVQSGRSDLETIMSAILRIQKQRGELGKPTISVAEIRNVITSVVGVRDVQVDVTRTPIEEGDEFIAISDGIGDTLTDREIEAIAREYSGDPVRIAEALVAASQKRVRAKEQAFYASQPIDALMNRGKDDDRSVVAIRIVPEVTTEDLLTVPQETLAQWERMPASALEATAKEYRLIIDAHDRGKGFGETNAAVITEIARRVSRAHGFRDAYLAAGTADGRDAVLQRDREYKEVALETLDGVLAARAGGTFADDYDRRTTPTEAQRWLTTYEQRLQALEAEYDAPEEKARAITRFQWSDGADDAQIQACLAAEREHVRRRIRQAKQSLQASGRKPGRAAGTNPPQPTA